MIWTSRRISRPQRVNYLKTTLLMFQGSQCGSTDIWVRTSSSACVISALSKWISACQTIANGLTPDLRFRARLCSTWTVYLRYTKVCQRDQSILHQRHNRDQDVTKIWHQDLLLQLWSSILIQTFWLVFDPSDRLTASVCCLADFIAAMPPCI